MAITKIHGWSVSVGTIDTDISVSTTVTQSGAGALHFKNTTPAADPVLLGDTVPISPLRAQRLHLVVRADSIAGGNTILARVAEQTIAKAHIGYNTVINSAVLSAANTWEIHELIFKPGSTARFGVLELSKNNTAFNVYVDKFEIVPMPVSFRAYASGATTLATTAFTKVLFATEDFDYVDNFASSAFTAPHAGIYHFSSAVGYNTYVTSQDVTIGLYKNGTSVLKGAKWESVSASAVRGFVAGDLVLAAGDVVDVRAWNGDGSTHATVAATTDTYFSGREVK